MALNKLRILYNTASEYPSLTFRRFYSFRI